MSIDRHAGTEMSQLRGRLATLHDGQLRGLMLEDDSSLSLHCRGVDGKRVTIRVTGVLDAFADNFREGNIILSIDVLFRAEDLLDEQAWRFFQSNTPDARDKLAQRWASSSGDVRFLMLYASYGCDLGIAFAGDRGSISIEST